MMSSLVIAWVDEGADSGSPKSSGSGRLAKNAHRNPQDGPQRVFGAVVARHERPSSIRRITAPSPGPPPHYDDETEWSRADRKTKRPARRSEPTQFSPTRGAVRRFAQRPSPGYGHRKSAAPPPSRQQPPRVPRPVPREWAECSSSSATACKTGLSTSLPDLVPAIPARSSRSSTYSCWHRRCSRPDAETCTTALSSSPGTVVSAAIRGPYRRISSP